MMMTLWSPSTLAVLYHRCKLRLFEGKMKNVFFVTLIILLVSMSARAQFRRPAAPAPAPASPASPPSERAALDKQIAAQFAPVIYQGLADQPRFDYITNFDFDGDWNGNNNWNNAGNKALPLRAYVYFSVIETTSHYFVHYAFFHPRDYKGGLAKSTLVDALIKEGLRHAGKDPTGLADDVALSHENDLEGCLIVAEKHGDDLQNAVVQYVETMSHNQYLKYRHRDVASTDGELIEMRGQHPLVFAEAKGHGVSNYTGTREQLKKSANGMLIYNYTGVAQNPDQRRGESIGYDLIGMVETLWLRAQTGESETYAETIDFPVVKLTMQHASGQPGEMEWAVGKIGAAFRGSVGFRNKARAPWGWYDMDEPSQPRGEWFFDPAAVIARHFHLALPFTQTYIYHPFIKANNSIGAR